MFQFFLFGVSMFSFNSLFSSRSLLYSVENMWCHETWILNFLGLPPSGFFSPHPSFVKYVFIFEYESTKNTCFWSTQWQEKQNNYSFIFWRNKISIKSTYLRSMNFLRHPISLFSPGRSWLVWIFSSPDVRSDLRTTILRQRWETTTPKDIRRVLNDVDVAYGVKKGWKWSRGWYGVEEKSHTSCFGELACSVSLCYM